MLTNLALFQGNWQGSLVTYALTADTGGDETRKEIIISPSLIFKNLSRHLNLIRIMNIANWKPKKQKKIANI